MITRMASVIPSRVSTLRSCGKGMGVKDLTALSKWTRSRPTHGVSTNSMATSTNGAPSLGMRHMMALLMMVRLGFPAKD